MNTTEDLVRLNSEIATRETAGDGAWFDRLLAPQFAMRRASLAHATRAEFLAAVAPSAQRRTSDLDVVHVAPRTAVVTCTVEMRQDDATWKGYRNVRLFARDDPGGPWQLLAWANEPAEERESG